MALTTTKELIELRKLAEAANTTSEQRAEMRQSYFEVAYDAMRKFEKAVTPPKVIALLDHIEALSAEVERLTAEADVVNMQQQQDGKLIRLLRQQLRAQLEAQGEAVAIVDDRCEQRCNWYMKYDGKLPDGTKLYTRPAPKEVSVPDAFLHTVVSSDGEKDLALSFKSDNFPIADTGLFKSIGVEPLFKQARYTHPAPAAPVVEMLQGYADSYKLMAKMGDGKVLAGNVAVDIERNMIHAAIHLIQPKGEKA
jgi:hypothetical protein